MKSGNRNVLLIVVGVLVAVCICGTAAVVVAAGWFTDWSFGRDIAESSTRERLEKTFATGQAPSLKVDSFAGSVTVRGGERDEIRVVATKVVKRKSDLERIQIDMLEGDDGLEIRIKRSPGLASAWVQLEITAPHETHVDVHTGSGSVDVGGFQNDVKVDSASGSLTISDVTGRIEADTASGSVTIVNANGPIDAHTNSGRMDVSRTAGLVRLSTHSGGIEYAGTPEGDCSFETGSGGITLALPGELAMEIDLSTGSGSIDMDFDVQGRLTRTSVKGIIGSGEQGKIYAHTGSGGIEMIRR
jgi:hypothetical protein